MNTLQLPHAFRDLEQWSSWSLPTEEARSARRQASGMSEIRAFYDAMAHRIDDALDYCNEFALESMPSDVQRLFYLVLSLAEVAPAVEQFSQPSVVDGYGIERFQAQRRG